MKKRWVYGLVYLFFLVAGIMSWFLLGAQSEKIRNEKKKIEDTHSYYWEEYLKINQYYFEYIDLEENIREVEEELQKKNILIIYK